MMKNKFYYILVLYITFIISIFVNYLGAAGYINSMTQKSVSDKYITLLTPANYAFSIWGIIYLGILTVVLYLSINNYDKEKFFKNLIFSFLINSLWIISFSYLQILISSILIVLLFLILLNLCILSDKLRNTSEKKLFKAVFGIYTGWLGIASIVNIIMSAKLYDIFDEKKLCIAIFWISVIMLLYIGRKINNIMFYCANIWALIAVIVRYINTYDYKADYLFLSLLASVLIIIFEIIRYLMNIYKLNKI